MYNRDVATADIHNIARGINQIRPIPADIAKGLELTNEQYDNTYKRGISEQSPLPVDDTERAGLRRPENDRFVQLRSDRGRNRTGDGGARVEGVGTGPSERAGRKTEPSRSVSKEVTELRSEFLYQARIWHLEGTSYSLTDSFLIYTLISLGNMIYVILKL